MNERQTRHTAWHSTLKSIVVVWLLLCGMVSTVVAQPVVSVSAKVNKDRILLGQQIELTLEAKTPGGISGWFITDTLPHFDVVEKGKIDTIQDGAGNLYRQVLTITSFDSGRWNLPAFNLANVTTDSIAISVLTKPMDYNQEYNDIKTIIAPESDHNKWIYIGVGLLTLLSLLLFIYFLRKSKLAKTALPQKRISPTGAYEAAIQALATLRAENLPAKGMTKDYYVRLTDIFRVYIFHQSGIRTMEKTSVELLSQLKPGVHETVFTQLSAALRMSDAVKFAKYLPSESDHEQNMEAIANGIQFFHQQSNQSTTG
jgi:hypothetical protein